MAVDFRRALEEERRRNRQVEREEYAVRLNRQIAERRNIEQDQIAAIQDGSSIGVRTNDSPGVQFTDGSGVSLDINGGQGLSISDGIGRLRSTRVGDIISGGGSPSGIQEIIERLIRIEEKLDRLGVGDPLDLLPNE